VAEQENRQDEADGSAGAMDAGTVNTGTMNTGTTNTGTTDTDLHVIGTDVISTGEPAPPPRRRRPDPLALLVGLATLAMAVFAFTGELPDLSGFDPRWLLAGGAAVVGLALLVGSLRGRPGGRRDRG
jgi:hypothetical protein